MLPRLAMTIGTMERRVFCFWTGHNAMSEDRKRCLDDMRRQIGLIELVKADDIPKWERPNAPFHPSFSYLSEVHKADYLRAYFMHHYGGGYADIKRQSGNWEAAFELLQKAEGRLLGVGYPELSNGVAPLFKNKIGWSHFLLKERCSGAELRRHYRLISSNHEIIAGNCAFIMNSQTKLTLTWLDTIHFYLDKLMPSLRRYPATDPRDHRKKRNGGRQSKYPLRWTQICGSILAPLLWRHRDQIDLGLPPPIFERYL